MDQRNFLDYGDSSFSEEARIASIRGISAYPLVEQLEITRKIAYGFEQIFRIVQMNEVQKSFHEDCDHDNPIEPPVSDRTIMGLLALGEAVSQMMVNDVESVAKWVQQHIPEGKETTGKTSASSSAADLSVAAHVSRPRSDAANEAAALAITAQAAAVKQRSKKSASSETREHEDA